MPQKFTDMGHTHFKSLLRMIVCLFSPPVDMDAFPEKCDVNRYYLKPFCRWAAVYNDHLP